MIQTPKTRADVEKIAKQISKRALEKSDLQAAYETRILEINNDVAPKIQKLENEIAERTNAIAAWAVENPEEFSGGSKIDFSGIEVAYKDGSPKVVILEKWDEQKVIDSLSAAGKEKYLRVKTTLEKRIILSDYAKNEIDDKVLKKHGLAIVKEPSVTVKIKDTITARPAKSA